MNLLMLTRYGRLGASSRLRSFQYLPMIEQVGWNVTVSPLFSDRYVRGLQSGRRSVVSILNGYRRRITQLIRGGAFDAIWIEKECLPWLPGWLEHRLLSSATPWVIDYDDAVFHRYDSLNFGLARRMLAEKHASLMRAATLVTVGNNYLADYAKKAGARRVELLPTAVDLDRYLIQSESRTDFPPCVGWIGQRVTAQFLQPLADIFDRLSSEQKARFTAIGIDADAFGLPMESVPWSESSEVQALQQLDIGIMPLQDRPFERGKCGYKLIQYMACGLPVIASPVGVNRELVEHGVNGFLAESIEEWEQALRILLSDAALRSRLGHNGRLKVEQAFCTQITGPRLIALLNDAVTAEG